jgi:hypothetical protein
VRKLLMILLIFFMAACTSAPEPKSTTDSTAQATAPTPPPLTEPASSSSPTTETATFSAYPDQGTAPEIAGEVWLNTDAPLRLADLRGKVVLIDMWTFG